MGAFALPMLGKITVETQHLVPFGYPLFLSHRCKTAPRPTSSRCFAPWPFMWSIPRKIGQSLRNRRS